MRPLVVYVSRTGLAEPLGQSQIAPYLRGLSELADIVLLTREKTRDWSDPATMARVAAECEAQGIDWRPRRFVAGRGAVAQVVDLAVMLGDVVSALRVGRGRRRMMHARSCLPAAVAALAGGLTGVPFVFDMRALWVEEMITAQRLARGSLLHRVLAGLERVCLRRAAGIVSLTHAAVAHLRRAHPKETGGNRFFVIPTCVDTKRFTVGCARGGGPLVHGIVGSVLSGWFRVDLVARWAALVRETACIDVVTQDDAAAVRRTFDPAGQLGARLTVGARPPAEMPAALHEHDLSVFFYAGGAVSELGRSPTRMAEVLACGLPVVCNDGVGDVAEIVRQYRVGVVLAGESDDDLAAAVSELDLLMSDPDLSARCRALAEGALSLQTGTAAYAALYRRLLRLETA